jgi:hypothetical protein
VVSVATIILLGSELLGVEFDFTKTEPALVWVSFGLVEDLTFVGLTIWGCLSFV